MNTLPPILPSIGDRPLKLASHLRHVSGLLTQNLLNYDWSQPTKCNCGHLVRSALAVNGHEFGDMIKPYQQSIRCPNDRVPTWASMATVFCPLNPDVPAQGFFATLRNLGLSQTDYVHLEDLSHPDLRAAAKLTGKCNNSQTAVAAYMKAWATAIEAFHAAKAPTEAQLDAVESRPLVTV